MSWLKFFGLSRTEQDEKLKQLVDNSYDSVRVVGRGTVKIDPQEVGNSEAFKTARKKAKRIVRAA